MKQFDMHGQRVEGPQFFAGRDVNFPVPLSLTAVQEERNRNAMLAKVRSRWITGVLEPSLHQTTPIELELHEQTDAVVNPFELFLEPTDQLAHLPSRSNITQIYHDAGGELLILGEPGSGKTMQLLELTRDLLDRAQQDDTLRMPVVFNLSSWAVKRQPLTNWLIEELNSRYQVPRKLGRSWVATDQILPLLDGLDEVPKEHQAACVDAINTYRQRDHGLVPVVVCCRRADYAAHTTRLQLRNAVVVQPLTPRQIDAYLSGAGKQSEAVRLVLRNDPSLRELATSPLMLSVLVLTYSGKPVEDIHTVGAPVTRQQVFADYVRRMLQRRGMNARYTPQQVVYWLTWLAQKMAQMSQTEFYLERMQPNWLLEDHLCTIYNIIVLRLLGGLLGGLVGGLVDALFMRLLYGLYAVVDPTSSFAIRAQLANVLVSGLFYILLGVAVGVLISGRKTKAKPIKEAADLPGYVVQPAVEVKQQNIRAPRELLGTTTRIWLASIWKQKRTEWSGGLLGFLLGGFFGWWVGQHSTFGLPGELVFALIDGLLCGWFGLWFYKKFRLWFIAGYVGGTFGVLYGIYSNQILALILPSISAAGSPGLGDYILYAIGDGLAGLLVGVLTAALISISIGGGSTEIKPAEVVAWSWRSVWQSIFKIEHVRNALVFGVVFGVVFGLIIGVRFGLTGGVAPVFIYTLIVLHLTGLFCGLSFWLIVILFSGFSSQMLDQHHITMPNQGIRRSARNSVLIGLIFGLTVNLVFGLVFELIFERLFGSHFDLPGLLLIMSLGTLYSVSLGALLGGGLAYIQHFSLRLFLYYGGLIPWNYHCFLDFASEHILLRKVGGGYIFVHRLLLEYFAALSATLLPHQQIAEQTQIGLPEVCTCGQPYRTGARFCIGCGKPIQGQLPTMQLPHIAAFVPNHALPPSSSKKRPWRLWVILSLVGALFLTCVGGACAGSITALSDPVDDPIVHTVYQYYRAIESQDYVAAYKDTDPGKINLILIQNCKESLLTPKLFRQEGLDLDTVFGKLEGFFIVSVSFTPPSSGCNTKLPVMVTVQEERNGRFVGYAYLWLVREAGKWKIILIDAI